MRISILVFLCVASCGGFLKQAGHFVADSIACVEPFIHLAEILQGNFLFAKEQLNLSDTKKYSIFPVKDDWRKRDVSAKKKTAREGRS
jgi:hypothetical protein